MTVVTGQTIAYIAVQVRYPCSWTISHSSMHPQAHFVLSSVELWFSDDGIFNYEVFFDNIVDLFETDDKHPWVLKMLEWWQRYVTTSHLHILVTFQVAAKSLALAITQRNRNVPNNRI